MKPGTKHKLTAEVRALALALFDDRYWQFTRDRLMAGTLNPRLEITLLAYAFGEPPRDQIDSAPRFSVHIGFLSPESLSAPSVAFLDVPHTDTDDSPNMAGNMAGNMAPPAQVSGAPDMGSRVSDDAPSAGQQDRQEPEVS